MATKSGLLSSTIHPITLENMNHRGSTFCPQPLPPPSILCLASTAALRLVQMHALLVSRNLLRPSPSSYLHVSPWRSTPAFHSDNSPSICGNFHDFVICEHLFSFSMDSHLNTASAVTSTLLVVLTLIHFSMARRFRGNQSGITLCRATIITTNMTATLLTLMLVAQFILYILAIIYQSQSTRASTIPILMLIAAWTLHYSGHFAVDRRRRYVAIKLASIPVFGDGVHAPSHPSFAEACAIFVSPFPPARRVRKRHSMPAAPSRVAYSDLESEPSSSASATTPDVEQGRTSPHPGIIRRLIWEMPCRSAHTWLTGHPESQMWPMHVVRTVRFRLKRLVLMRDPVVQDGFGADLLTPFFTHSFHIDTSLISRVVFKAVDRASLCMFVSWLRKFDHRVLQRYATAPAVSQLLRFATQLEGDDPPWNNSIPCCGYPVVPHGNVPFFTMAKKMGRHGDCYITDVVWAVLTSEIIDFLRRKRDDTPLLDWLVGLPQWLALQKEDPPVHNSLNTLAERWLMGRLCGSYSNFTRFRACDSSCCCHDIGDSLQVGCGCQCPCVCTCV